MSDPQPVPDGVLLCTSCGLCCTGALHDTAALDEDEEQAALAAGLPVVRGAERLDFALPCPRLEGTRCGIYPDRPRVCARYKCNLLLEVESGALPLATALGRVRTAGTLLANVATSLPAGAALPEIRAHLLPRTGEPRRDHPALRLHLTALTAFLDRHFRKPSEGRLLDIRAIASPSSGTPT